MNWLFGDNINTDLITPGRYNITTDPAEMARIAFIEYLPEFAKRVKPGDYIIAGSNFGCGSSRETAAIALKHCGLRAIIAKSFARIFYRNCLNQGLLAVIANTDGIGESDRLLIDSKKRLLTNKTKKATQTIEIPEFVLLLEEMGGIIPYLKRYGMKGLNRLGNV